MATQCDMCGRGALKAAYRSHSRIKTLRRQKLNLQSKRIDGKRLSLCTACIRKQSKVPREKAVSEAVKA